MIRGYETLAHPDKPPPEGSKIGTETQKTANRNHSVITQTVIVAILEAHPGGRLIKNQSQSDTVEHRGEMGVFFDGIREDDTHKPDDGENHDTIDQVVHMDHIPFANTDVQKHGLQRPGVDEPHEQAGTGEGHQKGEKNQEGDFLAPGDKERVEGFFIMESAIEPAKSITISPLRKLCPGYFVCRKGPSGVYLQDTYKAQPLWICFDVW